MSVVSMCKWLSSPRSDKLNLKKCQGPKNNKSEFEMWQQPFYVRVRRLAVESEKWRSQIKSCCISLQEISLGIYERAFRLASRDCGRQDQAVCAFGAASSDQSALVVVHLLIAFFCPIFNSSKGRSTFAALGGAPQEPFWAEEFWLWGLVWGSCSRLDGMPLH